MENLRIGDDYDKANKKSCIENSNDEVEEKDIADWFDVTNPEHIKAYEKLNETGHWPEGFIPYRLKFNPLWNTKLTYKLADIYIKSFSKSSTSLPFKVISDEEIVNILRPITNPKILDEVDNNAESRAIFCSEYSVIAENQVAACEKVRDSEIEDLRAQVKALQTVSADVERRIDNSCRGCINERALRKDLSALFHQGEQKK